MPESLTLDRQSSTPLNKQIVQHIRHRIANGQLPVGTRLPTVRELASGLGTTTLTVHSAYAELSADGWVEPIVGRGTFVKAPARPADVIAELALDPSPDGVLTDETRVQRVLELRSLASADPDPAAYPTAAFAEVLQEAAQDPSLLAYSPAEGDPRLRTVLVEHLRERGIVSTPDQLLVTRGASHALALLTRALTQPGDSVLVASPTYLGFLNTLQANAVEPLGVPFDAEGPDLEALERLIGQHRPRFFYTVPTYHNPTGVSLAPARREALLELARVHGLLIVEDDVYGRLALQGDAPPALRAGGDADLVVYVDSFSKVLMPSLRLGYVLAPPPLRERLRFLRQAEDLCGSAFTERALALFLERGHLRTHVRRVLPRLRAKRGAMLEALERFMPSGVSWSVPEGGFNLWVTLPAGGRFGDLYPAALRRGIAFAPGSAFLAAPAGNDAFRLSFGMLSTEQIQDGVEILAALIEERLDRTAGPGTLPRVGGWP